ncbi:MAG: MBL fold metallo-hydrolase [Candidatus Lindowbacteria bacterium]|nr:MBL fold metallo-hydrolase [Candidatus Lindowbacteria bacterium]
MNASVENRLAGLGICRIETVNPYSDVRTNCYFIDGAVPTLIDTALATEEAYGTICRELSQRNRGIRDIKRIILTHGHADHRALAPRIVRESGAAVFCHRSEAGKVVHTSPELRALRHERSERFFQSVGVPRELLPPLVDGPKSPYIKPRLDRVSFVDEGDEFAFDAFSFRVLHTPGHSCGSICLYDGDNNVLVTGDTLLPDPRITALLEFDILDDNPAYHGLKLHMGALERLMSFGTPLSLPGHGEPFDGHQAIANEVFERHQKRQRHILRALRNGRRTPYQICRSVFPFLPPDDLYLALSEIIGNMDVMEEEGRLIKRSEEDILWYEKA